MTLDNIWKLTLAVPTRLIPALEDALFGIADLDTPPTFTNFEIVEGEETRTFEAYFPQPAPAPLAVVTALETTFAAFGEDYGEFGYGQVEDRDWVSESLRLLAPITAGRFFVHGRHDADKIPAGSLSLEIEAGQAFGSGNHATTQGCLLALNDLAATLTPGKVLDLGCGSGILALGAARLWQAEIIATDIDPIAVAVTRENVVLNGVELAENGPEAGKITALVCDGMEDPALQAAAPFDLIVANILMRPLIDLAPAITAAMASGSYLVLSGLLEDQQVAVVAAYVEQGLKLERAIVIDGWAALILTRE
ncbi:50S ribosomal protein L11 methyltransferase [Govanella unica]|uniref:Ribosomal protein L11 methyltransferase n=1 Tax=Govanella unica TaxID=2975056 RepID=A0A9X3Z891_9PROT|nr:50S ribosomal protein L11 methyltransferase [Govania unica]MDA5195090.1 50S ribosomal protein L11 methyltransferase [Govania unica]